MTTFSLDLVKQFYSYWQIQPGVLNIKLNKCSTCFFRINNFKRPHFYSGLWYAEKSLWLTHTQRPNSILDHVWSHYMWNFERKKTSFGFTMLWGFMLYRIKSKRAISEVIVKRAESQFGRSILNEFVWFVRVDTHTLRRLVIILPMLSLQGCLM